MDTEKHYFDNYYIIDDDFDETFLYDMNNQQYQDTKGEGYRWID
tara:strand:- start:407 stop:538 length:132 start_codon:yes stop_codon:yes gene_type:complete